ncbi:MAG TPA: hypothetical protein VGH28_29090 [Polyangiaceae bacterium]|jgi:hypothetical protein
MRAAWLLVVATTFGCGGITTSDGDAGGDAGSWSPVCPATRPAEGSSCSHDELDCEYACGDVVICADGAWAGAVLGGGPPSCDAGPSAPDCPSTESAITPSASCANAGDTCVYSTGICACTGPFDPTPDAGATWFCGPESGCPMPRPRIGTACATPSQECDYAACGDGVVCTAGVWQPAGMGCGG